MERFQDKMTGVIYVWVRGAIKEIANWRLRFRGFEVLVEGVK